MSWLDSGDLKKAYFYICGMPLVRLARSQLRPEQIWERMLNVKLLSPRPNCPRVMRSAPRGAPRSVDRGAYRPSPPYSPPKVHLKNLASLRVKHLGANEAFDKTQMQSYPPVLVILGDAELNAVFHLLGINSRNSRLI